eukprot:4620836-Amphidinium_carterae.1
MSDLGFTVTGRLNTDSVAAKGVASRRGCGKIPSSSEKAVRDGEGAWSGEPSGSHDQVPEDVQTLEEAWTESPERVTERQYFAAQGIGRDSTLSPEAAGKTVLCRLIATSTTKLGCCCIRFPTALIHRLFSHFAEFQSLSSTMGCGTGIPGLTGCLWAWCCPRLPTCLNVVWFLESAGGQLRVWLSRLGYPRPIVRGQWWHK